MAQTKTFTALIGCVLSLLLCNAHADEITRGQMILRIKPVGQVKIVGSATKSEDSAKSKTKIVKHIPKGEKIYNTYCATCHAMGVAGAPLFRDKKSWKTRLAKGNTVLLSNAIKGLNAMPANGTCTDCDEADIKLAIEYMIPQKKS